MTAPVIVRTQEDIDEVARKVTEQVKGGPSAFRRLTYEDGVSTTLEWLAGVTDTDPMQV